MEVLVTLDDGIKGRWILWGLLQGPARRDPGGTAPPHDLQRGSRCGTPYICIRGDSNEGGSETINRRFFTGHPMADSILL